MRNNLIDLLRFIAFILMIIHHYYYFNNKYNLLPDNIEILGVISRTLFIFLSGISINFRKDNERKKSKLIFFYGLIISIISNLLINEKKTIFFGVLHFIGLSSLILDSNVKNLILITISSILLNNYIKNNITNNILHLIFSGKSITFNPLDTFQILEWLPLYCFGILLGIYIKKNNFDININTNKLVKLVSHNSLNLYMLNMITSLIWYKLYIL